MASATGRLGSRAALFSGAALGVPGTAPRTCVRCQNNAPVLRAVPRNMRSLAPLLLALLLGSATHPTSSTDTVMLIGLTGDNSRVLEQGETTPILDPPINGSEAVLLKLFGLGFVSGECVTGPDPTVRAQLRSAGGARSLVGVAGERTSATGIRTVNSVMYECVDGTKMRVTIFADTNCVDEIPRGEQNSSIFPLLSLQFCSILLHFIRFPLHCQATATSPPVPLQRTATGTGSWTRRCGRTR